MLLAAYYAEAAFHLPVCLGRGSTWVLTNNVAGKLPLAMMLLGVLHP